MISLKDIDIWQLLPDSLKNEDDVFTKALSQVVSEEIKQINQEIEDYFSKTIPEFLLDTVAYEKHVDFYDESLPIQQKRDLIAKSRFFHKQKGTPAAVEDLVAAIFGDGKVSEWFEYEGERRHFKVITSNRSTTGEMAQQFLKAVNSVKRLNTVLDKVEISMSEDMNLYVAGVVHTGDQLTIKQVM